MKDLASRWAVLVLLVPVLMVLGLILFAGRPPEAAQTPKHKGTVEVAFTTTNFLTEAGTAPALSFQRVMLNVISVRLNPSSDLTISDNDSKWQTIPVPAGVGRGGGVAAVSTSTNFGGAFGPNGTVIGVGQGRSEIQLDMNFLQNNPQIFNGGVVKAQSYNQVELVLDPVNPGNAVPLCGRTTPRGEGCIVYPAVPEVGTSTELRALIPSGMDVVAKQTQPLLINIDLTVGAGPVTSGDSILITPTINVMPNITSTTPVSNPGLAAVHGSIPNASKNDTVTAETTGTDQIVATASVQLKNGTGTYVMYLPPGNYDFYTGGVGRGFAALTDVNIPLGLTEVDFPKLATTTVSSLSGKVFDGCTGTPVVGATLQLVMPNSITPPGDCTPSSTGAIPTGCVVVASAATDVTGAYPLPGTGTQRAPFSQIPTPPTGGYILLVNSSGYNGQFTTITQSNLKCKGSGFKNDACSFNLERGEIDATVDLGATNTTGSAINVLIMAEDHGTNQLEGVGMGSVPNGAQTSQPVAMFVPDSQATAPSTNPVAAYDLFASAQDLFAGQPNMNNVGPQAATGHTLAVTAGPGGTGVPGPAKCAGSGNNPAPPTATLTGVSCVGFGSVAGTLSSIADQNTQVVLSKNDPGGNPVQVMTVQVAPMGVPNASIFNFCAPADPAPYTMIHQEAPLNTTPVVIGSFSTTLATPIAIPTPCAGICSQTTDSCLLCTSTQPNVSLP